MLPIVLIREHPQEVVEGVKAKGEVVDVAASVLWMNASANSFIK